jgi:hypothetical protein
MNDLLQIGVWNNSTGAWAKTRDGGLTDSLMIWKASDLTEAFAENNGLEAYFNGTDLLELRVTRLTSDITTTIWIDQVKYRSVFSKSDGEGKAPIGAKVTVEPATTVFINITAALTITDGYNADSIKAAVQANIDAYLKTLAFTIDNDVRYVRIGEKILDTPGVRDYTGLTVNEGDANIPIGLQEVAVIGLVTLT